MRAAIPSVEATGEQSEPAADNPVLDRFDGAGHSPEDVVRMLVAAMTEGRYRDQYSLYATPEVDYLTAEGEWSEANEAYQNLIIHEARVVSEDLAWVRISYEASTTPPGGPRYPVDVAPPGEWWPLHKVEGMWKVQWMPRQ